MAGSEIVCTGRDVASTIGSTPALREIRAGQQARITCGSEIEAQLPFLLVPVFGDDDYAECLADVNGGSWAVYPTVDGDYVVIPGGDSFDEPDMNPCWAEFEVVEGEWNPLVGYTSIGLLRPGIAIEYARYDHGGIGINSGTVVTVNRIDDFAVVFVAWLRDSVLGQLWGGDTAPPLNAADLFAEAAGAADRKARWDSELDVEVDAENDESVDSVPSWAFLALDLSDSDIALVRNKLSARNLQSFNESNERPA
ncbi:hypothetical protein [Mycolicibacterium mengxianglii]|uniref:hypothetical protein n=1 Tax=Mycolicibacterium mengxianglii TaxID=2736649 RepID=UPI0018D02F3E|nr:hypothetical protein [Mycolicibacterium mengxianglii]